jgi:hypothetical protein
MGSPTRAASREFCYRDLALCYCCPLPSAPVASMGALSNSDANASATWALCTTVLEGQTVSPEEGLLLLVHLFWQPGEPRYPSGSDCVSRGARRYQSGVEGHPDRPVPKLPVARVLDVPHEAANEHLEPKFLLRHTAYGFC